MLIPNVNEFQATLIACIPLFLCGMEAAFPADLTNFFQDRTITLVEESVVGSINLYSRVVGAFAAGYTVNKIGRKNSILVSLTFSTTAWIIVAYFSYNIEILYVGRIFSGMACAFPSIIMECLSIGMKAAAFLYVGEVAHKSQRGKLLALGQLSTSLGITFTYLLHYFFSPKMVSVAALIISAFGLVQAFFLHETKYWLLMQNRAEEAQISMLWFDDRMTVKDALVEIEEIQVQQNQSTSKGGSRCFDIWGRWSNVKHLIICMLIFSCRAASGRVPILVYPHEYYKLFLLPVSVEIATLLQGILESFFSVLNLLIADAFPRKMMLQSVYWIMSSCLMISYFQVTLVDILGVFGEYVNLTCLMVHIGLACGPLMSLTLITVTEIASTATESRGIILAGSHICNHFMSALFTSFFIFAVVSLPVRYVLIFIIVNLAILSLVTTLVPETVGKALHECAWDEEKEQLSETDDEDPQEFQDDTKKLLC